MRVRNPIVLAALAVLPVCGQQPRLAPCQPLSRITGLRRVGGVPGARIFERLTREPVRSPTAEWSQQIFSQGRTGDVCEIYSYSSMEGAVTPRPAYLIRHGPSTVLAVRSRVLGTGAFYEERYWLLTPNGPLALDLSPIGAAVNPLLPAGYGIWKGYGLNMERLCYSMPVWKPDDGNCCPTGGSVYAKLAIRGGRIVVNGQRYSPQEDASAGLCPPLP